MDKRKPGRPPGRTQSVNFHMRIDPRLIAAVARHCGNVSCAAWIRGAIERRLKEKT